MNLIMHTPRPSLDKERTTKTVTQILDNLKSRRRISYEQELIDLQIQEIGIQHRIRWILGKMLQQHTTTTGTTSTDEMQQVENPTPEPIEKIKLQEPVSQPHQVIIDPGPKTTHLDNPAEIARIAALETILLSVPLVDTGSTPRVPTPPKASTDPNPPRESFYTSDEALILLIDHGVKAHQQKHETDPDVIEMPQPVYDLLTGSIDMAEYVTQSRHIPFAVNTTLLTTTITHTIKCITY